MCFFMVWHVNLVVIALLHLLDRISLVNNNGGIKNA